MGQFSLITLIFFGLLSLTLAVDETLVEKTFGADVSDAVVRRILRTGIFPDDQSFFRRVGFTETFFGEDPNTYRDGYYGGIWQVDEDYFNLTKAITNPDDVYEQIQTRFNINWSTVTWTDLLKPFYSGLASRLYIQHLMNQGNPIPGTVSEQADYWIEHYRQNQTANVFASRVRALESDPVCEGLMDICIVLDGSGSIGIDDFVKAKGFVANLVKTFSKDSTRVSFIIYSDLAEGIFDFKHDLTDQEMDFIIRNATYPAQNTNTPAGLNMGVDFYEAIGSRNGVPQVITTLTDGLHNRGNLPGAMTRVRNASLVSFSVGIGKEIEYNELLQIALLVPKRVFMVNNFDALAEFFYQMNSATCEVPQHPGLGTNQTGSLNPKERRYFQYELPAGGIMLDIQSEGDLEGWYSYSEETPSSAVYDGAIKKGVTLIPNPNIKGRQEEEGFSVFITMQCNSNETSEYIIFAEESNQETTPQATTPEVTTPEATTPKVTTPEATTPEVNTPEATTPEVTTPEATIPEVTTPEATTPEVTTSEVSTPENTTPNKSGGYVVSNLRTLVIGFTFWFAVIGHPI